MLARPSGVIAAVLAIASSPTHADDADHAAPAAPAEPAAAPTRARRALAVGAAIVPGVIVRGAGHWVAGDRRSDDRRTARRLLVIEGVGLALAAAGGIPIGVTGGADETLPALALALPGAGLLLTSLAADVWGSAGGACIAGTPPPLSELDAGLGYTFLGDPRVPFANLATVDVTARRDRFAAAASGWLGDGTWRVRGAGGVRVHGPRPGERPADTSALDLELAAAEERRDDPGLRVASVQLAALARIDLDHIGPSLRGTFVTLGLGTGVERARYPMTGAADTSGLVNAHLGWGFALGDGVARSLETELYYEHGRDTLAGGLTLRLPANGFIGYVGAVTTAWRGRYGASVRLDVGSAYVLALSARIRLPELSP